MKKNSQSGQVSNTGRYNSRTVSSESRPLPYPTASQRTSASRSNSTNSRSKNSGTKSTGNSGSSNSNTLKIALIAVAVIIIVAGIFVGWYILGGKSGSGKNKKYSITLADGTEVEMTISQMSKELSSDKFFAGIIVDGIDLSGKTKNEVFELIAAAVPSAPQGVDISLKLDEEIIPLNLNSLSLESNYIDIVNEAYEFARPASDASDEEIYSCYKNYQKLKQTPMEYTTAYTVNTDGLSSIIHSILDPRNCEVVEAELQNFDVENLTFQFSESSDGYVIDIDKAVRDTKNMLDSAIYQGIIEVDVEITKPKLSTEDLKEGYGLVSEAHSSTTYDNSRNHNIKITCEKIDGLVLQPGESFSFNGFVGERTPQAGYELAGTIQSGKTELGYGGGICQLSTMIYQSVVKADLQVDERHPHQWPSSYCVTGTDAAVDWGAQDFKFTNSSDYPIAIHSFYDIDNYVVHVELYGHLFDDGSYIDFIGETLSVTPPDEPKYVANPEMPVGETDQTRSPHSAVSATSYKVWYDADGNEIRREEYLTSYYAKINAIIEVGVLNPDGTIAPMDETTGSVTVTETTVDPATISSEVEGSTPDVTPEPPPPETEPLPPPPPPDTP